MIRRRHTQESWNELLTAARSTIAGKLPLAPGGRALLGQTIVFRAIGLPGPPPPPGSQNPVPGREFRVIDVAGDPAKSHWMTVTGSLIAAASSSLGESGWIFRARWSSYGYETSADVDVVKGTTFSVFGSSLQVSVLDTDPFDEDFATGVPQHEATIGAFVAFGARPGNARAPSRTIVVPRTLGPPPTFFFAAGTSSPPVLIPTYARDVMLLVAPVAATTCILTFETDVASVVASVYMRFGDPLVPTTYSIPIPMSASQVTYVNVGPGAVETPRLVFGLAL